MPSRIIVGGTIVLALASAMHSGRHIWWRIGQDHAAFSAYSAADRIHSPAAVIEVDGNTMDWYADHLAKGDRFYLQVDAEHDPNQLRELAGYYLLPAVEVASPSQATAIVSYYTNPADLGIHYITQNEAGAQPIYVSRIKAP
ncbi:MAG TPA: hypothetical protein VGL76_08810 [Gaiellaceae bacterium]|jgi:hypothetical protein